MIEVSSLTMYYGSTRAVEQVSFQVKPGEILGLLGPNGAGKTTIMNILTTQIFPTSGRASINGFDVVREPIQVREVTGYLPENVPLYMDMEVEEYLRFVARGRGLEGERLRERLDWVIEKCDLRRMLRRLISHLSKGYRQRVGLAQALVHDPDVLILDEPTSGLDPMQIIGIRNLVKELSAEKTIVVSTHILQEVEAVSDRIVIINEGRIIADGTREQLQETVSHGIRRVVTVQGDAGEVQRVLARIPHVERVELREEGQDTDLVSFRVVAEPGSEIWPHVAEAVRRGGWLLKDSYEEIPTLEDVFIHLVRTEQHREGMSSPISVA